VSEDERKNTFVLTYRWWKCSTEHGQLRFTKSRWVLVLEWVFIIAILSCVPPAAWAFLGQPSFLGLLIAFSLSTVPSTILILRRDVVVREYLLDKETDGYYRNGKLFCKLSEIDHVRIEEEWAGPDYDRRYSLAHVVLRDREDDIPVALASKIASYIGVDIRDSREHRPVW